ncbi:unnamed protein product [Pleuronectes platessa]|uniref:Uncharacterized protein n=1 Tax=Pleuronectes platessa TaxID=8262 RepID=A0A9N7UPY0_PLEPL|nr:unnamed protein product [Pleuronectes platessa]
MRTWEQPWPRVALLFSSGSSFSFQLDPCAPPRPLQLPTTSAVQSAEDAGGRRHSHPPPSARQVQEKQLRPFRLRAGGALSSHILIWTEEDPGGEAASLLKSEREQQWAMSVPYKLDIKCLGGSYSWAPGGKDQIFPGLLVTETVLKAFDFSFEPSDLT